MVSKNGTVMNIFEFTGKFPTEESCREHLRLQREKKGVSCRSCGEEKNYWVKSMGYWKCSNPECKSTTNLRQGTIMEKSHVPVLKWYMCIHLMTTAKKPFSALEMQRQLGLKRYEPVWYMMQKIRIAMGKRDSKYTLKGEIEMDDAFFEVVDIPEKDELGNNIPNDEIQKRGRGSQSQQEVLVMVESTPNPKQDNKHKKKRVMGFVKMVTMDNLNSKGINFEVERNIEKKSSIITDGFRSFAGLSKVVDKHLPEVTPSKEAHKKLPWVHTQIANAKRELLGIHHSINRKYLQNYLNEFTYKLNRRNFESDMFDRMILAGANDTWY